MYKLHPLSFLVLLLVFRFDLYAQPFTDSNLPIVIITTDINPSTGSPYTIPDEPRVGATLKIIYHTDGSRNYVSDQNTPAFLNYSGRIAIEVRGSTSQYFSKKPYGFTTYLSDNITKNNVSLLDMPVENDWILNALVFDSSLVRDYVTYRLYEKMGNYAARTRYCEVMVNGNYRGIYLLSEKIKIDKNRIDIKEMDLDDNAGDSLTGGYITKCDKLTGGDPVAWTMPAYNFSSVNFIHDDPKPTDITSQQANYIYNYFSIFSIQANLPLTDLITGYPAYIDVPSFVDFMLINELASNVDAYQLSTYFHKDRKGKLRAGPIWDINLSYGNDLKLWGLDRSFTNVWQFDNGDNDGARFWRDLYDEPTFNCHLTKRWVELTAPGNPLAYDSIAKNIDEAITLISEASAREEMRWGSVGNLNDRSNQLKSWLLARYNWLNANLTNYSACSAPSIPSLVISKIHYNPPFIAPYGSDNLEFIELTNTGSTPINLSGFYFRSVGLTFQFPANSSIDPNQQIFIANDTVSFKNYYGLKAFGQYNRNLSNHSFPITLCDGWGVIIDQVIYADALPWPIIADGQGAYLKLIDLNLDNSLASSWEAAFMNPASVQIHKDNALSIFPNPSSTPWKLKTTKRIIKYEVLDALGTIVEEKSVNQTGEVIISNEHLNASTYFLKVYFEDDQFELRKITKL